MDKHLPAIDIAIVTLEGLSRTWHRKLALILTLAIAVGLVIVASKIALSLSDFQADLALVGIVLISMLFYLVTGKLFILQLAWWLVDVTPLGVLYRQDMRILADCRRHLKEITESVRLGDFLSYAKINPSIRSSGSMASILQQREGNLSSWIANPVHLKQLANLVYQIYLVERLIRQSDIQFDSR